MSAPFVVRIAREASAIAPCGAKTSSETRARCRAYPRARAARGAATTRDVASGARAGVKVRKNIRREETATRGVDASSKARETRERRAGEPVADGGFG